MAVKTNKEMIRVLQTRLLELEPELDRSGEKLKDAARSSSLVMAVEWIEWCRRWQSSRNLERLLVVCLLCINPFYLYGEKVCIVSMHYHENNNNIINILFFCSTPITTTSNLMPTYSIYPCLPTTTNPN